MRTNPSVAAKFYKMSAAEEDTELRDLLVQTLEKNGILGKIKVYNVICMFVVYLWQCYMRMCSLLTFWNSEIEILVNVKYIVVSVLRFFIELFNLDSGNW